MPIAIALHSASQPQVNGNISMILLYFTDSIGGSKGGGGGQGAMDPQRSDKNKKKGLICSILHYSNKIFPGGMPPDPLIR